MRYFMQEEQDMSDVDLGTGYVQLQETLEKARWALERKDEHIRRALANCRDGYWESVDSAITEMEQALKPD